MLKVKAFLLCVLVTLHATSAEQYKSNAENKSLDCDSYFSDVIQVEEKMMNDFTDDDLKESYRLRNNDMGLCLEFFTKFLAKLDHYLNNINDLENLVVSGEDESGYKRETRRLKNKNFWKRAKINSLKKFW